MNRREEHAMKKAEEHIKYLLAFARKNHIEIDVDRLIDEASRRRSNREKAASSDYTHGTDTGSDNSATMAAAVSASFSASDSNCSVDSGCSL